MKVVPTRKSSPAHSSLNASLLALVLFSAGCASAHREQLSTPSASISTPHIEVSQPALYRDANGVILAGFLETRGPGAHSLPPGHLHAELLNADGEVIAQSVAPAPAIRHNRFRPRETTHYTIHLPQYPSETESARVTLHRRRTADCPMTSAEPAARNEANWLSAKITPQP